MTSTRVCGKAKAECLGVEEGRGSGSGGLGGGVPKEKRSVLYGKWSVRVMQWAPGCEEGCSSHPGWSDWSLSVTAKLPLT